MTLIVIFALFIISPSKHFTTRLEQYTETKARIIKEVVEDKMKSEPAGDISQNKQLKDFITNFGKILGAKVWLRRPDGTVALKSFSGKIPSAKERLMKKRPRDYGTFTLYRFKHSDFYAIIPITFSNGEKGGIHILFGTPEPHGPERGFALGLIIIGTIIALLVIPISRFIIRPLKVLSQSALKIADGDLSHRVDVNCRDEIGDLCNSFNYMADKVEKMVKGGRELTANVSHELRTPLARIRIAEELLREKFEAGNYRDLTRHLDDILEDIEELDHLIGRILELSKLDIHESQPRLEKLDIMKILNELLARFDPVIEKKGFHLKKEISFNPSFMGDREAIYTAILNILDNAMKYTPLKGEVFVRTRSANDFLEISVINSYDKFAEKDLEEIFEPFHREERSKEKSGSGLGLAITKRIIERHGGEIEAFNSPEGLEIRIRLPLE